MDPAPSREWKQERLRITVEIEVAYDPARTDLHELIPLIEREFSNCNHCVASSHEFRGRAAYHEHRATF